jgi:hypothetical protein
LNEAPFTRTPNVGCASHELVLKATRNDSLTDHSVNIPVRLCRRKLETGRRCSLIDFVTIWPNARHLNRSPSYKDWTSKKRRRDQKITALLN